MRTDKMEIGGMVINHMHEDEVKMRKVYGDRTGMGMIPNTVSIFIAGLGPLAVAR